jgi:hypothetical protein
VFAASATCEPEATGEAFVNVGADSAPEYPEAVPRAISIMRSSISIVAYRVEVDDSWRRSWYPKPEKLASNDTESDSEYEL